jgi:5-methylcytosine-specific restriction enzyme A
MDGVTVVWTARPKAGGTVVVGWYRSATVYRDLQNIEKPNALQKKNGVLKFRVVAPANQVRLLHIDQRNLIVPRAKKGAMGQSNVWFADKEESRKFVNKVRKLIETGDGDTTSPDIHQTMSVDEGDPRLVAHLHRERNAKIVKIKKNIVFKETGKLCCEVCGFDFNAAYGEAGLGFCEVHHKVPLSRSKGIVKTELNDLAIVCSNCHRIIHRTKPLPTLSSFAKRLNRQYV